MYRKNFFTCLIIGSETIRSSIESVLKESASLQFVQIREAPISFLRKKTFDCAVLYWKSNSPIMLELAAKIKENFQELPLIGIVSPEIKPETIRKCGEIGVNGIIKRSNLFTLEEFLRNSINRLNSKITLRELDIHLENKSTLLVRALRIIEDNYLVLMGTSEIAKQLNITDCTLSREFKKNELLNPKRLLLNFKVKHSVNLMENRGLSLKNIARQSGFSNEQRFNSCFKKIYFCTPGEFRKTLKMDNKELTGIEFKQKNRISVKKKELNTDLNQNTFISEKIRNMRKVLPKELKKPSRIDLRHEEQIVGFLCREYQGGPHCRVNSESGINEDILF
ncbi:DNA-binding response regulator [Flagellimonas meridianipacifica]|uniref:AraC-like DNA-binding protein n=1 Tax=Flagellimonas meridianipacifica TaxID=1080225 RepID=A0A2T0MFM3_9FLAO|nr:DNA-binding response regulator [Allomuricauda pacifica]PRX56381.1 AraC-like DNA-binding protein [Allomuricauda pacifica]